MDEPPPLEGDPSHGASLGGDVVLVQELPEIFTVGLDCVSFTAKHFSGIRGIPPGPHFLWVAHPDGASTRCGVWIDSSSENQVHILQWDTFNEVLGEPTRSEARLRSDLVSSILPNLVPYYDPEDAYGSPQGTNIMGPKAARHDVHWRKLTDHVSERVLNRITGQQHGDWFTHTADRVRGSALMAAEVELDRRTSNLFHGRDLNFTFSQLSKTFSTSITGADRTLEATDATTYILSQLDSPDKGFTENDVIGEFQFAFIVGTHLGNDACMQQWWHMLLKVILRAYTLATVRPILAAALLQQMAVQLSHSLQYLETSILDYSESQARDLRLALTVYKRRLDDLPDCPKLVGGAFERVEKVVGLHPLEWDLDKENYLRRGMVMTEDGEEVEVETEELEAEDERGEWAPELVELDGAGREKGLVSWND